MKIKLALLSLVLTASVNAATNSNSTQMTTTTTPANKSNSMMNHDMHPSMNGKMQQNQKDGEVIAFLIVLNKNEINAAKTAMSKHVHPEVKSFATMLYSDHNQNLQNTLKLSKQIGQSPVESNQVASLKQKGKQEKAHLKSLKDHDFEVAFIDGMVNGHQEAIMIIDKSYLPSISNTQLKNHLQMTRKAIQSHLEHAKKIQAELQKNKGQNQSQGKNS